MFLYNTNEIKYAQNEVYKLFTNYQKKNKIGDKKFIKIIFKILNKYYKLYYYLNILSKSEDNITAGEYINSGIINIYIDTIIENYSRLLSPFINNKKDLTSAINLEIIKTCYHEFIHAIQHNCQIDSLNKPIKAFNISEILLNFENNDVDYYNRFSERSAKIESTQLILDLIIENNNNFSKEILKFEKYMLLKNLVYNRDNNNNSPANILINKSRREEYELTYFKKLINEERSLFEKLYLGLPINKQEDFITIIRYYSNYKRFINNNDIYNINQKYKLKGKAKIFKLKEIKTKYSK